jgi:heptosyltransferase-3
MLSDAIDLSALRRVLIIKLRHHGDVLLASPVFSVLKNHAPHIKLDALVYGDTADMLTFHPAIDEVLTIDRKWKDMGVIRQGMHELALLSRIRSKHYDLIIHLTEHPRGAWIRRLSGARYGVARKQADREGLWKRGFTHIYPAPKGKPRHTVELHLDALRRIGIQPDQNERRLILEPGTEARQAVHNRMSHYGLTKGSFIHIHPTSRWLFKCWPEARMSDLIRILQSQNQKVVVTAAPSEQEMTMVKHILRSLPQSVIDLSGQLSLKELAALTEQAKLFIGVDSAPMHIAAAMQTPVIALFGPSGDKEWGPWMTPNCVLTSDHVCRPCGNDGCGGGKVSECLNVISVESVLHAVKELLLNP